MTDLISRQATIKALCENGMCGDKNCNAFPCEDVKAIMRVPTIDPVKHGKWKNKQMLDEELNPTIAFRHRCSECRFEICTTDEMLWWHFCPNCGAKMERSEDDSRENELISFCSQKGVAWDDEVFYNELHQKQEKE